MKIVMPCCATKNDIKWVLNGREIKFIAHPELEPTQSSKLYCKPDDKIIDDIALYSGETWRDRIKAINQKRIDTDEFLKAADLYKPRIYKKLVDEYGWENVFILSAGWGIIRSNYRIPSYDITFSSSAKECKRRKKEDNYDDSNHLKDYFDKNGDGREKIYFFGPHGYLPLYYKLTKNISAKKIIYKKGGIKQYNDYKYIEYVSTQRTNWHYACAEKFIAGTIEK